MRMPTLFTTIWILRDLTSQSLNALATVQVELPVRLGCCARVMELALAESGRKAHTALPRIVVAFVTAQLKVRGSAMVLMAYVHA